MSGSPFRKIERSDPLVEVVLAQISQAIISGDLRPGDKLLETHLSEQLNVSRGPVREAICRLEQMRVVEKIPYRGTYVARLTQTDLDELHSIRAIMEALAVKLIIKKNDPAAIQELRAIIDRMREAAQTKDQARMIALDAAFHGSLIAHSNHKILQELWQTIRIRLHSFLLLKTKRLYGSLDEAVQIHSTIVTAIETGDVNRAMAEIQYHIDEAYKELIELELRPPGKLRLESGYMDLWLTSVRQRISRQSIHDISAEVSKGLAELPLADCVRPGMHIAIGVGSRGISCIFEVVQTLASEIRALGAEPFLVPAMGSHGGGTAEGQRAVLEGYGLGAIGIPILSSMETVQIGTSADGIPVHIDQNAASADGIIVVNRIKEHTAFKARWESGLFKILSVGLGKRVGAAAMHQRNIAEAIPSVARVVIDRLPIIAGVGIVENGYHQPTIISILRAADIETLEPQLLDQARRLLPKVPFDPLDLLIIREMGKDISGTGVDLNVVGMWRRTGGAVQPNFAVIGVLDLTENSHGNAIGVGHVDLITRRLYDKIDLQATYVNCLTSRNLAGAKISIILASDRAVIEAGLGGVADPARARVAMIWSTLDLEVLWVSSELLPEVEASAQMEIVGSARKLVFDAAGNLQMGEAL